MPTSAQAQEKDHQHLREALKICGYPYWTFEKVTARSDKTVGDEEKDYHPDTRLTSSSPAYLAYQKNSGRSSTNI